jgi:hypothetical protein
MKIMKILHNNRLVELRLLHVITGLFLLFYLSTSVGMKPPRPLLNQSTPVTWWFAFKFNAHTFPGCSLPSKNPACPFGGTPHSNSSSYSQQFVYASNSHPGLQFSSICIGKTLLDPLGATFSEVYNHSYYYLIWNDQFYKDPAFNKEDCFPTYCTSPWGHAKGMLVWNDAGEGFVLQVTTPSWPASGSSKHPRLTDGNTLGCIKNNNVKLSQHFFALQLTKGDVLKVLRALINASIVTDIHNPQVVNNGGPKEIQTLVNQLGKISNSTEPTRETLSSGVEILSKPSNLHVSPWRLVSSLLGALPLKTANFYDVRAKESPTGKQCWKSSLPSSGKVSIAATGHYLQHRFNLLGGSKDNGKGRNHAKIGVSLIADKPYVILSDMNEVSPIPETCSKHQTARGGLFYIIKNKQFWQSMSDLLTGEELPLFK